MAFVDDIFEAEFSGTIALVAGGTHGLGVAIAKGLAEKGAQVYIAGDIIEHRSQVWELSDKEFPGMCSILPKNLSSEKMLAEISLRHKKLHILIDDVAGGWSSVFARADAFHDLLLNGSGGTSDPSHIITIASSAQEVSSCPWTGKSADMQNARAMAAEFGDEHIVVNCIGSAMVRGADTTEVADMAMLLCTGAMPLPTEEEIGNTDMITMFRLSADTAPFLQAKL